MKFEQIFLLALLFLTGIQGALPTNESPPAAPHLEARGPIRISSDLDFVGGLGIHNGVRGGTGTVNDPYVISDWEINPTSAMGAAIWISGTSSSVLIRNLVILETGRVAAFAFDGANIRVESVIFDSVATGIITRNSKILIDELSATLQEGAFVANPSISWAPQGLGDSLFLRSTDSEIEVQNLFVECAYFAWLEESTVRFNQADIALIPHKSYRTLGTGELSLENFSITSQTDTTSAFGGVTKMAIRNGVWLGSDGDRSFESEISLDIENFTMPKGDNRIKSTSIRIVNSSIPSSTIAVEVNDGGSLYSVGNHFIGAPGQIAIYAPNSKSATSNGDEFLNFELAVLGNENTQVEQAIYAQVDSEFRTLDPRTETTEAPAPPLLLSFAFMLLGSLVARLRDP